MKIAVNLFAVLGVLFLALFLGGAIADYKSFDRTKGGYEPPYTEYTGEPINWDAGAICPRTVLRGAGA